MSGVHVFNQTERKASDVGAVTEEGFLGGL